MRRWRERVRTLSFGRALAAISAASLAIRIGYVVTFSSRISLGLDSVWYQLVAGSIVNNDGFVDPQKIYLHDISVPTAFRPPLYPVFLAGVSKVAGDAPRTFQYAGCVMGVLTVVLIGYLGRRIGGNAVGLCAAALAGVYPIFLAVDAAVMSETLYVPLVVGCVLAVYRAIDRPTMWRWSFVGLLAGAGILTRGDGLFLLVVLVVPAAIIAVRAPWQRRLTLAAAAVVVAGLVVAPWVIRNQQRLGVATVSTLQTGTALAGANCDDTYYGDILGSWSYDCTDRSDRDAVSEVAYNNGLQHDGTHYITGHAKRLVLVVPVRVLRQWSLYAPLQGASIESAESRNYKWQVISWIAYLPVAALAGYGLVLLRRRRTAMLPLVAVIVAVTVTAAVIYGQQRLRVSVEPVLIVAAAVAIVHLTARVRGSADRGDRPSGLVAGGSHVAAGHVVVDQT
jgi:4-amino-4-deoxy-L-arabinose transferase-like glycosyltransferase